MTHVKTEDQMIFPELKADESLVWLCDEHFAVAEENVTDFGQPTGVVPLMCVVHNAQGMPGMPGTHFVQLPQVPLFKPEEIKA